MKIVHDIEYYKNKIISDFSDELKQYEPDYDLPFMLFGSFALFARDLIKENPKSDLLNKIQLVVEEMSESENPDVKGLFMVGFLEVLADDVASVNFTRKNFNKKFNDSLDVILKFWEQHKKPS